MAITVKGILLIAGSPHYKLCNKCYHLLLNHCGCQQQLFHTDWSETRNTSKLSLKQLKLLYATAVCTNYTWFSSCQKLKYVMTYLICLQSNFQTSHVVSLFIRHSINFITKSVQQKQLPLIFPFYTLNQFCSKLLLSFSPFAQTSRH
jgi:hypothetical protein